MNEKIIIGFASYPEYSGNAKALYENFIKRKLDNYKLVWVVENKKQKERLEKINVEVICKEEENFLDEFEKVHIMIITHDQFINEKLDTQIFISLWHGLGPKRTGYALENEYEIQFAEKYKRIIDYMCVPSEFGKMLFSYIFNFDNNKIIITPFQRNRYLQESDGIQNLEKILSTNLRNYKKLILYAPTYKSGIGREEGKFNTENVLGLEKYDENILSRYLKENNYALIIKLHPSEQNKINKELIRENIFYIEEKKLEDNYITINEILNGVDCLITDYSSIYTDYLLLGRPVIFLNTDFNEYNEKRGIYFDSDDFWFPGPLVSNIEEFIKNIDELIKNDSYFKQRRIAFNSLINEDNKDVDTFINEILLKLEPKLKIPKVIHYIKTKENSENINQWKKVLKRYKFKEWDVESDEYKELNRDNNSLDLVKLKIIYEYGGVFLDTDIQVFKDFTDLLMLNKIFIIEDEYKNINKKIIGAYKGCKYINECIQRKWFGINDDERESVKPLNYKDLFVSYDEQYRIGKSDFQDKNKYFNDTKISLKNKIGRALKYGFLIGK